MTNRFAQRIISAVLVFVMVLALAPVAAFQARAAGKTYTLDTTADLAAFAAGAKADGDTEKAGTDNYFTIYYSAKTKVDGSKKTFEDAYVGTQRLNFGGKSAFGDTTKNAVQITTSAAATVKIWFVQGGDDNRQVAIFDSTGTQIAVSAVESMVKNSPYIASLEIPAAGTYYIGNPTNNNNLYKIEVTEEEVVPQTQEYILDTTADLTAFAAGAKADGDTEKAGTEDFFTIYYSAKTKVDGSKKTFEDAYVGTQRLNFGGKSAFGDTTKNAVQITTSAAATVKIWFVQGGDDNRQVAIFDSTGTQIAVSAVADMVKNSPYITSLEIPAAGTYFIGNPTNNNNFYKIQVTVEAGGPVVKPPRADWATVEAPVITGAVTEDGSVKVTVKANVGYDGGDEVVVTMLDAEGAELGSKRSIAEKAEHTLTFQPTSSGKYTFKVVLNREEETGKSGTDYVHDYVLPLAVPAIASATSSGSGKINVTWGAVAEATGYNVYCDGTKVGTTEELSYEVTGLTVDTKYNFTVSALRGEEESAQSAAVSAVATAEAQRAWGFTRYGSSTNDANNGYVGSINEDGKVTVYSEGGKGKIVPNSTDGVAFYYTTIPSTHNFTLRAKVTVDSWTFSNGQEGFGLMAADRLGPNGNSAAFWNNQYMALASKIEYTTSGNKYSMKLGLGSLVKTGVTPDNLDKLNAGDTATINEQFVSSQDTFLHTPETLGKGAGTYNIIGNYTKDPGNTIAELTTFILEIQRNNTGYFVSYYDEAGNLLAQRKDYDPNALTKVDADNIYVGFFASRNARATFSDVELTTILPQDDAPAEQRPVTYITPSVSFTSGTNANASSYDAYLYANVAGTADLYVNGQLAKSGVAMAAATRCDVSVNLTLGTNELKVVFTPDATQDLGEFTELTSTDPVEATLKVTYNADFAGFSNLYIAPNGTAQGNGTRENPLDIYTAISYVQPGQTIIVMGGTYKLSAPVVISRGIDGTAEDPIRMIADPTATARPVFDFQKQVTGITHGGDYWYFQGFDVTNSANGQKGFQVSGHHNTLDQINTYNNGNTGIQLSRYAGTDPKSEWPSYNLILNCTSYNNADAGYEDADGFAAKLTCGEGNVFDGCVAYNNADDGWDLYAKVETGTIGAVTIQNCVAYQNGYVMENGQLVSAGNGNGFKMGGESLSGKHKLINSYAFFNKAKGIDSNSCPDIIVENATTYNNESYNVAFYTNNAANTAFAATGIVSFKDDTIKSGLSTGENLKPKGTQDTAKYLGDTNYYWDGTASKNASGAAITADMFVSLEFKGVTRNADGTINLQGFLELNDKAPANVGAAPDGQPSDDTQLQPDAAITQKAFTLSYDDAIRVIDIVDLVGMDLSTIDLTKDAGLLVWAEDEFNANNIVYSEANAVPGLKPYQATGYYYGSTKGIFTRYLHEKAYYAIYVRLGNGSYLYSQPKLYSPDTYAYNMLGKTTTSAATKDLCVALLNYVSAAQMYFYPDTAEADLVNARLTDAQKALVWDNPALNLAPTVPTDKTVQQDTTVFTQKGMNLLFEEMISMVSLYKIDDATVASAQLCGTIFWTAEQFAALEGAPSLDNIGQGTHVEGLTKYRNISGQWYSAAPAVAPKDMASTQYFVLGYVVNADGTVSYSGVIPYSFEQYINNKVTDTDTSAVMREFAQRLYYYERAAEAALKK